MSVAANLTGIERELVLKYLIDGNVPLTIIPVQNKIKDDNLEIASSEAAVFPVAIKSTQLTILKKGRIILKNPPQKVINFLEKKVSVEFYFNKLGLSFITTMKNSKEGLYLNIPPVINKIKDEQPVIEYSEFNAMLYYSCGEKSDVNIYCEIIPTYTLFAKPVWSQIRLENQRKAKTFLENFVVQANKENIKGNGLQLISICRYLSDSKDIISIKAVKDRTERLKIIYADYERIVFGQIKEFLPLQQNSEYALKMSFPTGTKVLPKRDVFVTCMIEKIYTVENNKKACASCFFTSIKEEDKRFLYEKTMHKKLNY